MNRIVLIGNGFDLAHGLKTKYADFIKWYWRGWGKYLLQSGGTLLDDGICSFSLKNTVDLVNWYDVWNYHYKKEKPFQPWDELEALNNAMQDKNSCDFSIKSPLFEKICEEINKPWCSIEEIYYAFLKSSNEPKQVNDELELIKDKLIEYLNSLEEPTFNPIIRKQILEPISQKDIAIGSKEKWKEMLKERLDYPNIEWQKMVDDYRIDRECSPYSTTTVERFKSVFERPIRSGDFDIVDVESCPMYRLPDNIMLLNFNYTNTADMYLPQSDRFIVNHIHGSLSAPENVIFGYGDELDAEYKMLLDKNDNEYLRNIKSIKYQEVPNYRNMLRFIESSPYQIYIMGHSCGNSDRTMLNTLFEHRNCVSIKPFYHKWGDGTDNYMEIVQNIARNFTDRKLMRDRVVNKTFCETI